jgi:hypothetical protein
VGAPASHVVHEKAAENIPFDVREMRDGSANKVEALVETEQSKRRAALWITSRCPFVIGSKLPGQIATRIGEVPEGQSSSSGESLAWGLRIAKGRTFSKQKTRSRGAPGLR